VGCYAITGSVAVGCQCGSENGGQLRNPYFEIDMNLDSRFVQILSPPHIDEVDTYFIEEYDLFIIHLQTKKNERQPR
jgi:hypothetical protein